MNLMDDDDLKKSVIDQMMGELDDLTSNSLKKPTGPVKGVEVTIAIAPKHGEEGEDGLEDEECTDPECMNPMHDHPVPKEAPPEDNYISNLLKHLG